MRSYAQAVDFLDDLCQLPLVRSPGATHRRLQHLLQRSPTPTTASVHVVGTCGKGSTATLLASILQAAGLRCGLYTGPHLAHYSERIQVNGFAIPEAHLVEALDSLHPRILDMQKHHPDGRPTVLEVLTTLAMAWFAGRTDVLVIEAGMGGARDCTSILPADLMVLSRVGLDHQEFLGPDVATIATEKCGAIRPGRPVVMAPQVEDVVPVVNAAAAKKHSPVLDVVALAAPRLISTSLQGTTFEATIGAHSDTFTLRLPGRHQMDNAATALVAANALDRSLSQAILRAGVESAHMPGRIEVLSHDPLLLIDGAHNLDGARCLRDFIDSVNLPRPRTWIAGVLADKDRSALLQVLTPVFDEIMAVLPHAVRAGDAGTWLDLVRAARADATAYPSVEAALAARLSRSEGSVVVAGSLYLAGEARASRTRMVVGRQVHEGF